jgi:HSP20 family molecular chaperone IbpA
MNLCRSEEAVFLRTIPLKYPRGATNLSFRGLTTFSSFQAIHSEAMLGILRTTTREGTKMPENRIRIAPNTVAYADEERHKLVVEFAIPGAPTDTIDLKILADSVHLTAPARDIEYVSALALAWPVKPDKAEAIYEHGLLRIEVPFKDPMEDAVKVAIKASSKEIKAKKIEA